MWIISNSIHKNILLISSKMKDMIMDSQKLKQIKIMYYKILIIKQFKKNPDYPYPMF